MTGGKRTAQSKQQTIIRKTIRNARKTNTKGSTK